MKTPSKWLRYAEDRRAMGLLLASSSLYVTHWVGGNSAHWLVIPGALLAISACVVKHNHIHTPIFRQPRLNRALNVWLALLTGTSTTGIRVAHNQRHHRSNQSPEDFVRSSLVARQPALVALVSYFPLVVLQTWRHAKHDGQNLRARSAPLHRLRQLEQAAIWVLIGAAVLCDWRQFVWVLGIPWLVAQWFLVTINLLQHDGLDERDPMLDSRNVIGPWSNWLFLNNGYHTAHHRRPALHWSLLPAFHRQEIAAQLPMVLASASLPGLLLDWWKSRSVRRTIRPIPAAIQTT